MKNIATSQRGFSIVEGVFVVIIVVIIGAVGYLAYNNFVAPKASTTNTASDPSASSPPVTVTSTKDLDTVSSTLDNLQLDDSDSGSLDSASNSF